MPRVLIVQSGGYYGSAIMSTDKSVDKIDKAVRATNPRHSGFENEDEDILFTADWGVSDDCYDLISLGVVEREHLTCPEPTILFDSGSGDDDLKVLTNIKRELDKL